MIFKKFSELTDTELKKIINKHYSHWSQYSPTMDYNNTKVLISLQTLMLLGFRQKK